MAEPASPDALLEISDLQVEIATARGTFRAVDGVSLQVPRGRTLGIVGESGCGKSLTALSVLRLLREPPARVAGGRILFEGMDLLTLPEPELRRVRGRRIAMVFQEPATALNPVYTAGAQIAEALRAHRPLSRAKARARAVELLRQVGIPAPEERADCYPHQLSGGMRQRVMIAMALSCDPDLLIADEPTTALDVTVQAEILELLGELQRSRRMSLALITHDMGVVAEACDEVAVMYAGRVVERATARALFRHPAHPYTEGLLRSIPDLERRGQRLHAIPGSVPAPFALPSGCRFRDRCDRATELCAREDPPLQVKREGQFASCHHPLEAVEAPARA